MNESDNLKLSDSFIW